MMERYQLFTSQKINTVLQSEASECGLACLVSIANYYGKNTNLTTLRARFDISLKGVTLDQLMDIADQCDLQARPLQVPLEQLTKLQLPAVLHWDLNHFVVVFSISANGVKIMDPAKGLLQMSLSEVSKHFSGVAAELSPKLSFKPEEQKQTLKLWPLFKNVIHLGASLKQILALALCLQVFSLATPFFMQLVVDKAIVSEDVGLLTTLGIGFLLLALIQALISATRAWAIMVMGNSLDYHLQRNLFRHLIALPLSFFEKRHMGDIISRFDSMKQIQNVFSNQFIEAIVDGSLVILTLAMMALYSIKLTAIVVSAAAAYGIIRTILYRPLKSANEEAIYKGAKKQSCFLESLKAIHSIKSYGNETKRYADYDNLMVDHYNAGVKVEKLGIFYRLGNALTFGIENVSVIWLGGYLALQGEISVGMLFAFIAYKRNFIARITALTDKVAEFKMLSLHLQRVADIALTTEDEVKGIALGNDLCTLSFKNIAYRFSDTEPYLFKDLNAEIKPGETVAIIGPSGRGKSTLLKILTGLIRPSKGSVYYGEQALGHIDKRSYRRKVCSVTQEDQLIAGSIKDNILFGANHFDESEMINAAKIASIHEELQALPMGYNSLIGDMGTVLSSGQKQRVLLARALYRKPQILVLDEATSHLDLANEKRIINAIKQLNITQILVAHRPHTIASADKVLRLLPNGLVELEKEESFNGPIKSDVELKTQLA